MEKTEEYSIRVFNWNNNLTPISNVFSVTGTKSDFYGNDTKTHSLPAFLSEHPKDLNVFDEMINQYFGTKYEEFMEIKQRYVSIIEAYDAENGYYNPGNVGMAYGSKIIDMSNLPSPENQEEQISVLSTQTPSLTITGTTSTSITFDVIFPVSGQLYNTVRIVDFNSSDGLTNYHNTLGDDNVWGDHFQLTNGTYTINNLIPGGVYIIQAMWFEDTSQYVETICRRIQLPYNMAENISNKFNITLEYVDAPYPIVSDENSSGSSSEVNVPSGSYSVYQFKPTESAIYYIYTSPFAGSGVSNDTYLEVYTDSSLSGTPIASNDDYDGGRFSKVSISLTEGTTYYVKVRHYNNGQLHAELNITKNIPIVELTNDGYEDIITANGEFSLFSFIPEYSSAYVFDVTNYNSGTSAYDTYIKLYENESLTKRIGNDNTRIIARLKAGQKYYLQFSGFLMKYARGRINARQGQTLEFTKSNDSSFIYVNSPEYITKYDIVDDTDTQLRKIFEQQNITGKNTFYQTHTAWWGENKEENKNFYPTNDFYMDIDFYNPTASPITINIANLAYGVDYSILQNYYNGGINTQITIPAGEHRLLFESLNAPLLCTDSQGIAWARTPVILFDFNVSNGGNVTLSSLAAYNRESLRLKTGEKNILEYNNSEIDTGEIIYGLDIQGNPAWENHIDNPRPNESDLYAKYKGIAINQSAWIDSKLEFLIDDTIASGKQLELYLKDDYYSNGIANPKLKWLTNLNPLNDEFEGSLYALPGHKHTFTYHRDKGGIWNFAFNYKNLKDEILENAGDDEIINIPVSEEIITKAKENVSLGWKKNFAGSAPEPRSISMGAYGVTYHYTITITNKGTKDRSISPSFTKFENMSFGYKQEGEALYSVQYNSGASYKNEQNWWKPVNISIPANSTITFEIVYLIAAGQGGTHNSIIVN